MHYYAKFVERHCADSQELRKMILIRRDSLVWLKQQLDCGAFEYVFRNEDNNITHIFLEVPDHQTLHDMLDPDPLISYCTVEIEPILLPTESARSLETYLDTKVLADKDWEELKFEHRPTIQDNGTYFLARKTVNPFSPLLPVEDQNRIHMNTLISQTAHLDNREIVDYNPVGKPVGILVMTAESETEVYDHVSDCEVYIDSAVEISRLLTLKQATDHNNHLASRYMIGEFKKLLD